MKVRITKRHVYDAKGKELAIDTEIDVKGDEIPNSLVNKCLVIGSAKVGKAKVTNPAKAEAE